MGRFKMLIVDDDTSSKGYPEIPALFPGVFDIEEAECFIPPEVPGRYGVATELLQSIAFDVILLDNSFHCHEIQGPDIAVDIRTNPSFLPENRAVYLIGVSRGWSVINADLVIYKLRTLGVERGLDEVVDGGGSLYQALRTFVQKRS